MVQYYHLWPDVVSMHLTELFTDPHISMEVHYHNARIVSILYNPFSYHLIQVPFCGISG